MHAPLPRALGAAVLFLAAALTGPPALLGAGPSQAAAPAEPAAATRPGGRAPARPAPPRKPAKEPAVPFTAGETLTYDVSWSTFVTAGSATLAVREKKPSFGSTAYYIVAEGRPIELVQRLYPLYYKLDTLLDAVSLLPQRGSIYSDENGDRRMQTTMFDQGRATATYEVRTATATTRTIALPAPAHDALSVVYAIRTMRMQAGATATFTVADAGKILTVRTTVVRLDTLRTGTGPLNAWRVEPVIEDAKGRPVLARQMAVWLSDDARRVPVRMTAELPVGTFAFTLRDAWKAEPRQ
jgi:hypothetical protein